MLVRLHTAQILGQNSARRIRPFLPPFASEHEAVP